MINDLDVDKPLDEDGNVKDKSPFYVVVHKGVIEDENQQINEQTRIRVE